MRRIVRHCLPHSLQISLTVLLCLSLLSTPLGALPTVPSRAAEQSLHQRNYSPAQQFATLVFLWRRFKSLWQSGVNLDTMRSNSPQQPAAYQPGNPPPSSYDDPKPARPTMLLI